MINILVNRAGARLYYTCNVVFKHILKTDFRIIEKYKNELTGNSDADKEIHISYLGENINNCIVIPNSGLLEEKGTKNIDLEPKFDGFPKLFYIQSDADVLDFDLFSAVFVLVTEYEKYHNVHLDKHGRYNEKLYQTVIHKLTEYPLVNIYCEHLWAKLSEKFQGLKRRKCEFDYKVVMDIDLPWAYINKGIFTYGGFVKDLLKFDKENLKQRKEALKTGNDPYSTYDGLFEVCNTEKVLFFFLDGGKAKEDGRFYFGNKHLRALISEIDKKGFQCGIHPSYKSHLSMRLIRNEKEDLEKILRKKVTISRQHFLKYRLPETYLILDELGIKNDFTSTLINDAGFRTCTATPYPWYNLRSERQSPVIINPVMVMDVSLKNYCGLDPDQAYDRIVDVINKTADVNGTFILSWHNSSLSESHGWEGWKNVFLKSVEYLKSKSIK